MTLSRRSGFQSCGDVSVTWGNVSQSSFPKGRIRMYGSPCLRVMGIMYPPGTTILGTRPESFLDLSSTMHPKASSCGTEIIVLESVVMSAQWCMIIMISPADVLTTPPAVTIFKSRTVWSSKPHRLIVRSDRLMTFMSVPAMDPLAPRSIKAFHRTVEVVLKLRRLTSMFRDLYMCLPFLALDGPKLGWFSVPLSWVVSLSCVCGLD